MSSATQRYRRVGQDASSGDESSDEDGRVPRVPVRNTNHASLGWAFTCTRFVVIAIFVFFFVYLFLDDDDDDADVLKDLRVNRPLSRFDLDRLLSYEVGEFGTTDYRVFFTYDTQISKSSISPWHDISWIANPEMDKHDHIFHFVCEVPRGTKEKLEMVKEESFNPIRQDIHKDGTLRSYDEPLEFNYGFIPQTWEDPRVESPITGLVGDGDPIDVIELGNPCVHIGEVKPVYVVGLIGLIDNEETDFKLLAIDVDDVLAKQIWDYTNIPAERLSQIKEFLRTYKVRQGGAENRFAFEGHVMPKKFAYKVIEDMHSQWYALQDYLETIPSWRESQDIHDEHL